MTRSLVNKEYPRASNTTQQLSLLIHGYASKPDMSRIVNVFHIAQFLLRSRVWLEWVPSAANLGDLPSRLEYDAFFRILPGSHWTPTGLPSQQAWASPLLSIFHDLREYLA